MTWSIVGHRPITSPDGLTALEREQLYAAGRSFDGADRAPALRFVELPAATEGDEDGDGTDYGCFGLTGFLSVSKVYDGGRHLYDL